MKFGTDTYRLGARQRMDDATKLLERDGLSGAVYLSGLAVEGMLRSLIWLRDKKLDERHKLREMAVRVEVLGLLRRGERDHDFVGNVQRVARSWVNELRFAGDGRTEEWFRRIGIVRKRGRNAFRQGVSLHVRRCTNIVKRCEVLWQRQHC